RPVEDDVVLHEREERLVGGKADGAVLPNDEPGMGVRPGDAGYVPSGEKGVPARQGLARRGHGAGPRVTAVEGGERLRAAGAPSCSPSKGLASRLLWSVMKTKRSPARFAAAATCSGVLPPSERVVCTWTTPLTLVKPSSGAAPATGSGRHLAMRRARKPKTTTARRRAERARRRLVTPPPSGGPRRPRREGNTRSRLPQGRHEGRLHR